MRKQAQAIRIFFFSQQLADGIRTTLAVLLPTLVAAFFGRFTLGMTISLGALCASIADTPGPIVHRRNSMLICLFFVFATAVITGFARLNIYTLGIAVTVLSFFFSLLNVYGQRASFVGNAALLVMVLTMDQPIEPASIVFHSFLIVCGGLFYLSVSLLSYRILPYRRAQWALGECVRELATFLRIKASFYDVNKPQYKLYHKLIAQQIVVSEKQDAVRELMFKTRRIIRDPTPAGNRLLLAFTDAVDLFEDITASYHDHSTLNTNYKDNPALKSIAFVSRQIAQELDRMGVAIQTSGMYQKQLNFDEALIRLKQMVDEHSSTEGDQKSGTLKRLLVNMRKIMMRTDDLRRYFQKDVVQERPIQPAAYAKFVGHQSLDPGILWNNLNLQSTAFKHALRVAIACFAGFVIAKWIATGHHSYWIIMTITFMLKPSYSLTKQRNLERILGTVSGGILGILLLYFINDKSLLFSLLVLFMLGTYSLQRINYFAAVVCMTPFILILFSFLGIGFMKLMQERMLDTVIGCTLAFLASYTLFPEWESKNIHSYLLNMLRANSEYLHKVVVMITGKTVDITEYKLARKEVYVSSANLSAAFQRMLSEPKSKRKDQKALHQFVVLNHILFSNVATLAALISHQHPRSYPVEVVRSARKALNSLCSNLKSFDEYCTLPVLEFVETTDQNCEGVMNAEDVLVRDQLEFIYRLSCDIGKTVPLIIR